MVQGLIETRACIVSALQCECKLSPAWRGSCQTPYWNSIAQMCSFEAQEQQQNASNADKAAAYLEGLCFSLLHSIMLAHAPRVYTREIWIIDKQSYLSIHSLNHDTCCQMPLALKGSAHCTVQTWTHCVVCSGLHLRGRSFIVRQCQQTWRQFHHWLFHLGTWNSQLLLLVICCCS